MTPLCLTLGGARQAHAAAEFNRVGLGHTKFFRGIQAQHAGIHTIHPYEYDAPDSRWTMGPLPTGCWIGHRMLWAACLLLDDDVFLIFEDDVKLGPDWADQFAAAMQAVPSDWDALYLGSCCTADKPTTPIRGNIYEVKYPFCLHAYALHRKALLPMIETQDAATCYGPIDITLTLHSWPTMRVYTVLPRIAEQRGTEISP
jgi:GR25 family glycosyltransferase involved in LPS biosynthesis